MPVAHVGKCHGEPSVMTGGEPYPPMTIRDHAPACTTAATRAASSLNVKGRIPPPWDMICICGKINGWRFDMGGNRHIDRDILSRFRRCAFGKQGVKKNDFRSAGTKTAEP